MSKWCFVWQYKYGCLPLHIEILNSSSKILVLQWLLGIMLVYSSQKVKLYAFQRGLSNYYSNTAHILDKSSCHQHQQQRHHNENTKICMFINYMYVDILFPLTKAISVMFERVTPHYQTLQTWIGHDATHYHNLNALLHGLPYIFSQFNMARLSFKALP